MSPLEIGTTSSGASGAQRSGALKIRIVEDPVAAVFETKMEEFFRGTNPPSDGGKVGSPENDIVDIQYRHDGTTHLACIIYAKE